MRVSCSCSAFKSADRPRCSVRVSSARTDTNHIWGRRHTVVGLIFGGIVGPALAEENQDRDSFVIHKVESKGYQFETPKGWSLVEKAGADTLFKVPDSGSSDLGVTITPVRISKLEQLGTIDAIGNRLVFTEKQKESTKFADLKSAKIRTGQDGTTFYSYEYLIYTTRGDKRVLSTVGLSKNQLYIINGRVSCSAESCDVESDLLKQMRRSVDSFTLIYS